MNLKNQRFLMNLKNLKNQRFLMILKNQRFLKSH
jgi:hypothetical protein